MDIYFKKQYLQKKMRARKAIVRRYRKQIRKAKNMSDDEIIKAVLKDVLELLDHWVRDHTPWFRRKIIISTMLDEKDPDWKFDDPDKLDRLMLPWWRSQGYSHEPDFDKEDQLTREYQQDKTKFGTIDDIKYVIASDQDHLFLED